jgi:uncharacterized protein (DUF885 family)
MRVSVHAATAERLVGRYLDHVREHEPVRATRLGLPGCDGELPDLAPGAIDARVRSLAALERDALAALDAVVEDADGSALEEQGDLELLTAELAYRRFTLERRPALERDPLAAVELVSAAFHELLHRIDLSGAEAARRIDAATQRARRVPVLLEQAGSLLASAPAPHLELALQRLPGVIALVRDGLPRRAAELGMDATAARDAAEVAAEGLEAFGALLMELSEEPSGQWRLGPEDHAFTLRTAMGTAMRGSEVHTRARAWRDRVRIEMAELASATWARRFPGEPVPSSATERISRTLDAIAERPIDDDDVVAEARRAVAEVRAFVVDRGFVDVPPAARLRIAPVPPYLRGIAVAFIMGPPPFAPRGGSTFYVSPVPSSWTPEQARSYLREYTPAQLRTIAMHETYPGHFVQLEHAARHPRIARRLLTRPVFAEGWAVYVEREMIRAGFGRDDTSAVDADDLRITQRKLELRIATNAMLDVGLHAGDLDDPAAMELLTAGAFQAADEARGKLARAKVAPGQLAAYFVGGEELQQLRGEVERDEGAEFDARAFHQRVLSHGTPTIEIVQRALADRTGVHRPFAVSA